MDLFKKAIESHINYSKGVIEGEGIDRHLLGLAFMSDKDLKRLPDFFKDHGYKYSQNYTLSTSNLSSKYFTGGFAPVISDGYGINYGINDKGFKCSISKWISSKETDNEELKIKIEQSLDDLAYLLDFK